MNVLALKMIVPVCIVAVAFLSWLLTRASAQSPQPAKSPTEEQRKAAFDGLRNQALRLTRSEIGLPAGKAPTEPFAVIMEIGFEKGSATILALGDGNASIYLSSGGGSIGGAGHDSIRKAAQAMVALAASFQKQTVATNNFPLPKNGQTIFYLLTDKGVFTASAPEQALGENQHALSPLFYAGQDVITQYRLIEGKN